MYPAPARPSLGWKLLQSWWVVLSLVGFGCFSGAGLLLVGLRARKPGWWGSGVAYLLFSTGMIVAFEKTVNPDDPNSGGGFAAVWLILWLACVVHSFVVNVFWLRWLEERRAGTGPQPAGYGAPAVAYGSPAAYGSPVAFGSPVAGPASAMPYSAVPYSAPPTPPAGYPAQQPVQQYGVDPFPSTSTTPWAAPTPWVAGGGPVDVNTADAGQLATLEDFDAGRVGYVLSERARRGGYSSLAEFAATAQLTPQQFERIQHRLTLTPPRRY